MRALSFIEIILTVFMLISCNEDFLQLEPISSISEGKYYQNEDQINGALIATYSRFGGLAHEFVTLAGFRSDNFQFWQYSERAYAANDWSQWRSGLWEGLFNMVFRANQVINNLEDLDEQDFETNKSQYEAEARFLRGYAYFWLVRCYGQLPIVTGALSMDEALDMPRSPISDVYTMIEEDLQFAVSNLEGDSHKGIANKYVAEAILARVYIMQSGYPVNTDKYNEAIPLLEDIIQNGGYELEDNYADIFTLEGENGPEVLWSAVCDDDQKGRQHSEDHMLDPNAGPNHHSYGEYQTGENDFDRSDLWLSFEEGDSRKEVSVATTGFTSDWVEWTGLWCKKYLYGYVQGIGWTSDYIFVRYANILLLYAESLHKTGHSSIIEDKWGIVNRIRNRADLSDVSASDGDFMDILMTERRHEFIWEGVRWFDLVRTNTFVEELKKVRHDNAADYWKFLPIPKVEMDKMAGQWENNEGYPW